MKVGEWLKVRAFERLGQLLSEFSKATGTHTPSAQNLDRTKVEGFTLAQVAELQARCDLLDAQVESMQETKH